ncbi:hypothetical protein H5410_004816 [Solanum commersonii]|uniref:Uncharacterized protein n=1 Tax=Solanum commersonii TaxID=4109 RepID=A0A9J6A4N9_SOLCO|nr:hypothetical protein H5410_004816 [Solanum commersonii]
MATDFMNRFGFNVENAPDWFYIQNLKKNPSESFRDYAIRWRSEMKDYFIRAQDPQYYDRMMLVAEKSFAEIIKLGERIEEDIKSGTIINLEALQATNKALQSGTMTYNETTQLNINDLEEVKQNEVPEELIRKVEKFEEKPNPNLVET